MASGRPTMCRELTRLLWQGVKLAALGLVTGLLVAVTPTRLTSKLLYRMSATDPIAVIVISPV